MDEDEIERAVSNIVGNLGMEGCKFTEADIEKYKAILRGELDVNDEIESVIKQYKRVPGDSS